MIIRQSAFGSQRKMLKGNLHCHTTRSDGKGSPEEVIRLFEHNGYDFLAITDHRNYNYQNFAPGSKLTIIPAMEMDRNISERPRIHCFHSVWLGRNNDANPYQQDVKLEGGYVKDQHEFQKLLDEAHANGHLTTLCHPQWSGTFTREFEQLRGNFAIELWNSTCVHNYRCDQNNGWIWDELLMQGQKIYGIAVDDGHAMTNHCNGWVMVNAENNVDDILDALKDGAFYASTGPEIHDFYIGEDGSAHVKCSPCADIRFHCAASVTQAFYGTPKEPLTEAVLPSVPDFYPYLRAEVTDAQGRTAWTNPIFLKD